jgi:hypothetical protein
MIVAFQNPVNLFSTGKTGRRFCLALHLFFCPEKKVPDARKKVFWIYS